MTDHDHRYWRHLLNDDGIKMIVYIGDQNEQMAKQRLKVII